MNNRVIGVKKSQFSSTQSIPSGSYFDFVYSGQNYRISSADFAAALGLTGTIVQGGDPLDYPVLDKQGFVNVIRNLSAGPGIAIEVTPENGLQISATEVITLEFDTVADMVSSPFLFVGARARTRGYSVIGDGGSNDYEIIPAGTSSADGGSYIDCLTTQARGLFVDGKVRVQQFGANETDDAQPSIQAALDYSKTVYIDGIECQIGSSIVLDQDGARLISQSKTGVIKPLDTISSSITVFRVRGDNSLIEGVVIDGNNANPPVSGENNAVNVDPNTATISNVEIRNCEIRNFDGYGVFSFIAGQIDGLKIRGCYFHDFTNDAATPKAAIQIVQPVSKNVLIENCTARNITGACCSVRSNAGADVVESITVTGCIFDNSTVTYTSIGVEIWNGFNANVTGNQILNNRIGLSAFCENFVVTGNTFYNSDSYAFEAGESINLTCSGNSFQLFNIGIICYPGAGNVSVTGNVFRDVFDTSTDASNQGQALKMETSGIVSNYENITFSANQCYDCSGVRLERVTRGIVTDNIFELVDTDNLRCVFFSSSQNDDINVSGNTFTTSVDLSSSSGLIQFNGSNVRIANNNITSTTAGANVGVGIINNSGAVIDGLISRDNFVDNFTVGQNLSSGGPTFTNSRVIGNLYFNCTTGENLNTNIIKQEHNGGGYRAVGDADLVVDTRSARSIRFASTLTADRTVTLPTVNVYAGQEFFISRVGGAFNLNVGGLKTLAANQWCEVVYSGSTWVLRSFGSL